ncbi:hypothetical protein GQR58_023985 [Nymphon striatum]|nr:hypothetical protein GQR58_023985 [Nymphon striatum]
MNPKQKQVIEFSTTDGCRLSDIHRKLYNVYGDDTIDKRNVHRLMNILKEGKPALKANHAMEDNKLRSLTRIVSEWINLFARKDVPQSVSLLHKWTMHREQKTFNETLKKLIEKPGERD